MMFAAIAFLWTFIRLLGNMIITRRVKKKKTRRRRRKYNGDQVLDKTKEFIKDKINVVEKLDQEDLEILTK